MTRKMKLAKIWLLAATAVATFAGLDLLKAHVGVPLAYAIGAGLAAILIASLIRK